MPRLIALYNVPEDPEAFAGRTVRGYSSVAPLGLVLDSRCGAAG